MKRLKFCYSLKIEFDSLVTKHSFTVRCYPQSDERQKILQQDIRILPEEFLSDNKDSFGNIYFYGRTENPHSLFEASARGVALTGLSECTVAQETYRLGMFLEQTPYTKPGDGIKDFADSLGIAKSKDNNLSRALAIMDAIRSEFTYEPGVTDISTTAEQAWNLRRGVCQDYSHIMLSLCRLAGIPCRYVAGMLIGEGFSHAWVEIADNGMWYGIDPTNGIKVYEEHIKISHGRDYKDCLINEGVFTGSARQTQTITVSVQEE